MSFCTISHRIYYEFFLNDFHFDTFVPNAGNCGIFCAFCMGMHRASQGKAGEEVSWAFLTFYRILIP